MMNFKEKLKLKQGKLTPRAVYEFCVKWLGQIHLWIERGFLAVFRTLGKWLGYIPWGFRYTIAFAVAALILLVVCINGSSLFLLQNITSMDSFADRNTNKIGFNKGDLGVYMSFQIFDLKGKQLEEAEQLKKMVDKAGTGEGAVPDKAQLELVHELSGVQMKYLEDALNITVQLEPVKLTAHLKLEKKDGSGSTYDTEILDPSPEKIALAQGLAFGERFMPGQIPDLMKFLEKEEEPGKNGKKPARKKQSRSIYDTKIDNNADAKEVTKFTYELQKSSVRVVLYLQPIPVETCEDIELQFDEDNTKYTYRFKQFAAYRESQPWTIIPTELGKMNEKLRQLAAREDEQTRIEVRDKVATAVESYKASRGLRRLDLKTEFDIRDSIWSEAAKADKSEVEKLTPDARKKYLAEHPDIKKLNDRDEIIIRDSIWASLVKKAPLTIEKKTLKGSQIGDWYTARFKEHKFNQDNLRFDPTLLEIIYENGLLKPLDAYFGTPATIVMILLLASIALSVVSFFVKVLRRPTYYLMLTTGVAFTAYWFFLILMMFDLPNDLLITVTKKEIFDSSRRNEMWFDYLWFWMPCMFYTFFLWFPLLISSAKKYFLMPIHSREPGDVIETNLTCKGANPGLYRSFYWVVSYHIFFLLVLPVLLHACYMEDEYRVPKGDGGGQVQPQKVVQKKKKNKKKKIVLNPNSAFIFAMPDMPDEELLEEIDEKTADQYVTSSGTFGPGKKGGKPGWPNGMDNGVVRFIRLKYSGGDWDQDMGKGSDYNILLKIKEYAGFNIASDTEYITVDELQGRFKKKGKKPPFVYITGMGGINMTTKEVKQLRDYLLKDGGMLFADNGGGHFDSSIRNLLRRVLPNHSLVDIANDDMIYQQPFYFPNGAPRLWHHSGDRALGIKNNGRWIVFYHQGDINDAWKTGGSGCTPQQQSEAYKMGCNVIAYAFGAYLNEVYGDSINSK